MSIWRWTGSLELGTGGGIYSGTGDPSGAVAAPVGSLYLRTDGGVGTTLYIKQVGTNSVGWSSASGGGGGGTAAGSTGQVQFNSADAFSASANFVWDTTSRFTGIPGLEVGSLSGLTSWSNVDSNLISAQSVLADTLNLRYCGITQWSEINVPGTSFSVTSVATSVGGSAVYSGTFSTGGGNAFVGKSLFIIGLPTSSNNGRYVCSNSSTGTITLNNANAVSESAAATATICSANSWQGIATNLSISGSSGYINLFGLSNVVGFTGSVGADEIVGINSSITTSSSWVSTIYGSYNSVSASSQGNLLVGSGVELDSFGTYINAAGYTAHCSLNGPVTNAFGVWVKSPIVNAVINNLYGLFIDDQTIGGTNNHNPYSIYSNGGISFFRDPVTIGAAAHGAQLKLAGATSGVVTISTLATAGTWSLNLPNSSGTPNQVLTTDGAGNTSWTSNVYLISAFGGDNGISPISNQKIMRHIISGGLNAVSFPNSLNGSYIGCLNAPTSSFVITIKKANVSVGTMTIAAGQTAGTISFSGPVTTAPGDIWDFVAPAVTDISVAGIYFVIAGTRS